MKLYNEVKLQETSKTLKEARKDTETSQMHKDQPKE
jgi:hypothetical protein